MIALRKIGIMPKRTRCFKKPMRNESAKKSSWKDVVKKYYTDFFMNISGYSRRFPWRISIRNSLRFLLNKYFSGVNFFWVYLRIFPHLCLKIFLQIFYFHKLLKRFVQQLHCKILWEEFLQVLLHEYILLIILWFLSEFPLDYFSYSYRDFFKIPPLVFQEFDKKFVRKSLHWFIYRFL